MLVESHTSDSVLDRYREARAAIGTTPFDEYILEEFISVLSPYRRRFTRTIKTSFYLVASSLANKVWFSFINRVVLTVEYY